MQERLLPAKQFCLDTSFIVRLFESFPRTIHASLWAELEKAIKGKCHIICEVERELRTKFDEQYAWCIEQNIPVAEIDEDAFLDAQKIVGDYPEWIKLTTTDEYFADPFIVAHARQNKCVVVTAEKGEEPAKKRKEIKIPDVCDAYKIKCIGQGPGEIEIAPVNKFLDMLKIKV